MKKKYIIALVGISVILSACSSVKNNHTQSNNLTGSKQVQHIAKQESSKAHKKNLSAFDKDVIKLAVEKNKPSLCNQVNSSFVDYCKKLVKDENKKLANLDCGGLQYLKTRCKDKLYLKNLNCDNIKEEALKRQCIQEKNLKEALEKGDKDYCNHLPYPRKQKCLTLFKQNYGQ